MLCFFDKFFSASWAGNADFSFSARHTELRATSRTFVVFVFLIMGMRLGGVHLGLLIFCPKLQLSYAGQKHFILSAAFFVVSGKATIHHKD